MIPPLPLELFLTIASFSNTGTLFALARTSHTLHALLGPTLEQSFTADLRYIAKWAMRAHNPRILSRVLVATRALSAHAPATSPTDPNIRTTASSSWSARQRGVYVIIQLHLTSVMSLPIDQESVMILKLALSHGLSPVSFSWWSMNTTEATTWLSYGVQHGDVELVRWLLRDSGAKVRSNFKVEGGKTLLDLARYRRFEKSGERDIQETIIQLLVDHGPKSLLTQFPGVRREDQRRLEEMLKVAKDPRAVLDAWVQEEEDKVSTPTV